MYVPVGAVADSMYPVTGETVVVLTVADENVMKDTARFGCWTVTRHSTLPLPLVVLRLKPKFT